MKNIPLKQDNWNEILESNVKGFDNFNPNDLDQLHNLQEAVIWLEDYALTEVFGEDEESNLANENFLRVRNWIHTVKSIYNYFDENYKSESVA
jgi:hypothetical protein